MGVIQNAINQTLGTVGIAARLSPEYETKQELHKLGKQETALSVQQETLRPIDYDELEEGRTIGAQQYKEILEKQAEVAQRQFELNPTKESMRKAAFARSAAGQGPLMSFKADPEEIMMEQEELRQQEAMDKVGKKQGAQLRQKRKFKDYLSKLETSLGGTVGDLPEKLQKQILKSYSPQQRRQIMNQMDKEKKDGNK